jgi:hypothetical protein
VKAPNSAQIATICPAVTWEHLRFSPTERMEYSGQPALNPRERPKGRTCFAAVLFNISFYYENLLLPSFSTEELAFVRKVFAQPDPFITDGPGAAGVITSTVLPSRQIQFATKLQF